MPKEGTTCVDTRMSSTGRRKKTAAVQPVVATEEVPVTTPEVQPVKKSRASKKVPPVVAVVGPAGVSGSFLNVQRPLIAHIPITSASLVFDTTPELMKYDPNIVPDVPKPYDETNDEYSYLEGMRDSEMSWTPTQESHQPNGTQEVTAPVQAPVSEPPPSMPTEDLSQEPPLQRSKLPNNYSEKLMVLFQDSNRTQALPTKTEVACFWCCHGFQSAPVAIPSHILDETWYMYGNFCSPECATAYLFKEKIDTHVQWERYALLNSLYAEDAQVPFGSPRGIRPAPPREVLRMFGGSMDISEYRAVVHEKKLRIDVLTPPMVSIIQTMDTKPIDFYDQNLKNVFIRNDIQHKYHAPGAQGLRLRRTKPVKSRESTVEWAMKIQTSVGGSE